MKKILQKKFGNLLRSSNLCLKRILNTITQFMYITNINSITYNLHMEFKKFHLKQKGSFENILFQKNLFVSKKTSNPQTK